MTVVSLSLARTLYVQIGVSPRVEAIAGAMAEAGIAAVAEPDIRTNAWEKLVSMACTGPVGGLARAPLKMIATVPQTRGLLKVIDHAIATTAWPSRFHYRANRSIAPFCLLCASIKLNVNASVPVCVFRPR